MSEKQNEASSAGRSSGNRLKEIDVHSLEQAIAKTLGDIIGVELNCRINDINFGDRDYQTQATFRVSLSDIVFKAKNVI